MPGTRRDRPSRLVPVLRVGQGEPAQTDDTVVVEEPLQLDINGQPFAVIMRTPGADRDLALGFLLGERIVHNTDDLVSLVAAPQRKGVAQHNVVEIVLGPAATTRLRAASRAVTTNASCGLCGRQTIDSLVDDGLVLESALSVDAGTLAALPARMRAAQDVFELTGGLHAAALFTPDGTLVAIAEDVGRHNAVDKISGSRWWAGAWPPRDHVLCVSGRLSYEIILKALIAGIPVVVAVSAPSTFAIDLAERSGLTVAGFVRDGRMNVYAHGERIRDKDA